MGKHLTNTEKEPWGVVGGKKKNMTSKTFKKEAHSPPGTQGGVGRVEKVKKIK